MQDKHKEELNRFLETHSTVKFETITGQKKGEVFTYTITNNSNAGCHSIRTESKGWNSSGATIDQMMEIYLKSDKTYKLGEIPEYDKKLKSGVSKHRVYALIVACFTGNKK